MLLSEMEFRPWGSGDYWVWCPLKAKSGTDFGVFTAMQAVDMLGHGDITEKGNYMVIFPFNGNGPTLSTIPEHFLNLDVLTAQCIIHEMLEK